MCVLCVSRIGIGSILSIAIIILKINNDTFTVSYCCWLHECITLLPCQHMIITLDTHGKKKKWYRVSIRVVQVQSDSTELSVHTFHITDLWWWLCISLCWYIYHMLTYNANERVVSEIKVRHQHLGGYNITDGRFYVLLPNNISELNHYICGPLTDRKD